MTNDNYNENKVAAKKRIIVCKFPQESQPTPHIQKDETEFPPMSSFFLFLLLLLL